VNEELPPLTAKHDRGWSSHTELSLEYRFSVSRLEYVENLELSGTPGFTFSSTHTPFCPSPGNPWSGFLGTLSPARSRWLPCAFPIPPRPTSDKRPSDRDFLPAEHGRCLPEDGPRPVLKERCIRNTRSSFQRPPPDADVRGLPCRLSAMQPGGSLPFVVEIVIISSNCF